MRTVLLLAFIVLLSKTCFSMSPLNNDYSDKQSIYNEFRNVFDNGQGKSFTVTNATPNVIDLADGEFVIYRATANAVDVFLALRVGTTIFWSPNIPLIRGR